MFKKYMSHKRGTKKTLLKNKNKSLNNLKVIMLIDGCAGYFNDIISS